MGTKSALASARMVAGRGTGLSPCSIAEIVLLATPASAANPRIEYPERSRMARRAWPFTRMSVTVPRDETGHKYFVGIFW